MGAERARPRTWAWVAAVCAGVCVVVLGAIALRWAGGRLVGATSTVRQPQPCTLGALPPSASADGGIVAALVSSTYPAPKPLPRGQRYATPAPTATTITLCVLRASDGAELAHFGLDGTHLTPYTAALRVAPDGSAIYVASSKDAQPGPGSGRICALRPGSGTTLWCDDLDAFPSGLLVAGRDVYIDTFRSLNAIDAATGRMRWQNADVVPAYAEYGVRPVGSVLVGVSGDDVAPTDEVCAWRMADGSVAWCTHTYQDVRVQDVGADAGYVTTGMSFADGSGLVEQLSAESGRVIWTLRLPESRVNRIVDADGITYVMPFADCVLSSPTCQSNVLMLREATGTVVGQFSVYGEIRAFTVSDGIAITTAQDSIAGVTVPGSRRPPVTFAFRPHGFVLYGVVGVLSASALYTGSGRIGVLSFATGDPIWEADGCGDAIAGSATATAHGGTTIWCHWPAGSTVMQAAIQGAAV